MKNISISNFVTMIVALVQKTLKNNVVSNIIARAFVVIRYAELILLWVALEILVILMSMRVTFFMSPKAFLEAGPMGSWETAPYALMFWIITLGSVVLGVLAFSPNFIGKALPEKLQLKLFPGEGIIDSCTDPNDLINGIPMFLFIPAIIIIWIFTFTYLLRQVFRVPILITWFLLINILSIPLAILISIGKLVCLLPFQGKIKTEIKKLHFFPMLKKDYDEKGESFCGFCAEKTEKFIAHPYRVIKKEFVKMQISTNIFRTV